MFEKTLFQDCLAFPQRSHWLWPELIFNWSLTKISLQIIFVYNVQCLELLGLVELNCSKVKLFTSTKRWHQSFSELHLGTKVIASETKQVFILTTQLQEICDNFNNSLCRFSLWFGLCFCLISLFFAVVKTPLGNAFHEFSVQMSDKLHVYGLHQSKIVYQWDFNCDKHLRQNLIFQFIYFSSAELSRCHFAKLIIFDCKEETFFWNIVTETQDVVIQSNYKFIFCGIHSTTNVYSKCSNLAVQIQPQHYVAFDIHFLFSVFDRDKVRSIPLGAISGSGRADLQNTRLHHLVCKVDILVATLRVNIYSIVVPKFLVVYLQLNISPKLSLKVFNGPGPLSKLLTFIAHVVRRGTEQYSVTSSFQCVIHCFDCSNLAYSSHISWTLGYSANLVVSPGSFHRMSYSNSFDGNITYLLKLQTKSGFHLNLSVTDMSYMGQNNTETCSYAGVAAYENESEISTLCLKSRNRFDLSNYNHSEYVFQTIYSSNENLLVVLYSYELYGSINLTLTVSTTTCELKPVSICDGEQFKQTDLPHIYSCPSRSKVILSMDNEGCNIVQISLSQVQQHFFSTGRPKQKCLTTVHTGKILASAKNIQMSVTGFFRGKFTQLQYSFSTL